jgi:AcrR family transcriptional regulator
MPPRHKASRNEILRAARNLIRDRGPEGLNARDLGASLGLSPRPIYSHFTSMEELRNLVMDEILTDFIGFLLSDQGTGRPLLDIGLAEVRFARAHPREYRMLQYPLMYRGEGRDRRPQMEAVIDHLLSLADPDLAGLDRDRLRDRLLPRAIFTHGLADLVSRGFRPTMTDEEVIGFLRAIGQALGKVERAKEKAKTVPPAAGPRKPVSKPSPAAKGKVPGRTRK